MAQLFASPTDLVKVQMQAEGRRVLQGQKPRFTSCRQVYAVLYKESGILGFWRGEILIFSFAIATYQQLIASSTDLVKMQMQVEARRVLQGKKPKLVNLGSKRK